VRGSGPGSGVILNCGSGRIDRLAGTVHNFIQQLPGACCIIPTCKKILKMMYGNSNTTVINQQPAAPTVMAAPVSGGYYGYWERYTAAGFSMFLCLSVMVLTIICYAMDYGMFKHHGSSAFGTGSGTVFIGFFHEKGNGESTSDFNCYPGSNSKCKSDYGDNARRAAQTALAFSIAAFILSLFFAELFIGLTLRMLALAQLVVQAVYIITAIVAYARLREYFEYSLNVSDSSVKIDNFGRCWVAAIIAMCVAWVFTLFGPCMGCCVVSDAPRAGFWRL
jgi:hypothetical protein